MPSARSVGDITIAIDTRERYPFRFSGKGVTTERTALPAGDYGVKLDDEIVAVVERKTLEDLATSLSDGTLAFQLQRLGEVPRSAVAVEGRYSSLLKLEHVRSSWLADVLVRLQVRYPGVQVVFADSRKFAEDWTYRFLVTALGDVSRTAPRQWVE